LVYFEDHRKGIRNSNAVDAIAEEWEDGQSMLYDHQQEAEAAVGRLARERGRRTLWSPWESELAGVPSKSSGPQARWGYRNTLKPPSYVHDDHSEQANDEDMEMVKHSEDEDVEDVVITGTRPGTPPPQVKLPRIQRRPMPCPQQQEQLEAHYTQQRKGNVLIEVNQELQGRAERTWVVQAGGLGGDSTLQQARRWLAAQAAQGAENQASMHCGYNWRKYWGEVFSTARTRLDDHQSPRIVFWRKRSADEERETAFDNE
jgi:hypothetical protein